VVQDHAGAPLQGVQIHVVGLGAKALSDENGHYVFETRQPVMDRPTPVRATRVGYFPEESLTVLGCHWVATAAGQPPECRITMDFQLRPSEPMPGSSPTCAVSGRILAAATATAISGAVLIPGTQHGGMTDSVGVYRVAGVPRGLVELEAVGLGWWPQRRLLWVGCDDPDTGPHLDFRLNAAVIQ
jgi:hypothetical protein